MREIGIFTILTTAIQDNIMDEDHPFTVGGKAVNVGGDTKWLKSL